MRKRMRNGTDAERNGTDAERNGYGVKMRNGTDLGLKRGTERIWDKMRHFKLYQKFYTN
jgi:hypothetical protein